MSLLTLEPDETARAYLTRAFAAPRLLGVPALGAASANGEVIEVYGPSRSGKTELLLHVSCWWALSASRGGGGRSVVFLDTESRLCRPRLRAVAEALVASRPREPDAEADAEAVEATLERITVAACRNTLELLARLEIVERRCEDAEAPLLVVDSVGAYFWTEDRPAEDKCAAPPLTGAAIRAVSRLLSQRKATLIASKPAYFEPKAGRGDYHPEYLPREWTMLVRRRLCLARDPTPGANRFTARYGELDIATRRASQSRDFHFTVDARGWREIGGA